jgi:hypothetical protein
VAGNDQLLDLTCPLIDLIDLGIAHELLHRILSVESSATEDLKRENRWVGEERKEKGKSGREGRDRLEQHQTQLYCNDQQRRPWP